MSLPITKKCFGCCLVLAAQAVGCATLPTSKLAKTPIAATEASPAVKREVQTIRQEPTSADGQTSWIIEPDVPRIPKIAGMDSQLPPHIERRLNYAFDLAQRGATYSANAEFRSVLGLCALELDAREGGTHRRDALREGLTALDEADELAGHQIEWQRPEDLRRATAGHSTPVLKGELPPAVDSVQAVQLYYAFAEKRFAESCEGMPGASLAYYGLARTYVLPGTRFTHAAGKSVMLQRVALRIAPQNVLAGNELGVLMAQHGHLKEAEALFRQCVATDATPESWQNLAAVYARQGDEQASQSARDAGAALAAKQPQQTGANAQSTAPQAAGEGQVAAGSRKSNDEAKTGIWAQLDLNSKLNKVFRR